LLVFFDMAAGYRAAWVAAQAVSASAAQLLTTDSIGTSQAAAFAHP
jgi:hypothetical protein